MYLSGNPKTKSEAARWLRIGIELTVLNSKTNRPIDQKDGAIEVTGLGWNGVAALRDGLVIKLT
ncbi:MAG: hypothetical protein JWP89_2279 [Schlesneria sp.]|nr:hypothetical protein [Schlesneria sp.]